MIKLHPLISPPKTRKTKITLRNQSKVHQEPTSLYMWTSSLSLKLPERATRKKKLSWSRLPRWTPMKTEPLRK